MGLHVHNPSYSEGGEQGSWFKATPGKKFVKLSLKDQVRYGEAHLEFQLHRR
jgi:hypothetical protein